MKNRIIISDWDNIYITTPESKSKVDIINFDSIGIGDIIRLQGQIYTIDYIRCKDTIITVEVSIKQPKPGYYYERIDLQEV